MFLLSLGCYMAAVCEHNTLVVAVGAPWPNTPIAWREQVLARSRATVKKSDGTVEVYKPSVAVMKRLASRWPRPKWHAPWKTYRVISGHLGWASSIAFEPGNEWFATGSGDRTVKIWDTASGTLKLTLTGHTEQVTGLAVSDQFPYMFSCGLDKKVMCWDLEQNKVCCGSPVMDQHR